MSIEFNRLVWLIALVAGSCIIFCQHGLAQDKEAEPFRRVHSVALNIGHVHSFHGYEDNGGSKTLILPYWGFDYNFQFARKFALGVHVDHINESFEVEKNLEGDGEVVKRTRPLAPALMGFYKLTEHWGLGLGVGGEFSKEETLFLNRAAVEYGVEIRHGWEVFGVIQYDFRWHAYDTWTIGLGIGKSLGKNEKR